MTFMCINLLAVQSSVHRIEKKLKHAVCGREVLYSTLSALIAITNTAGVPPLNGPHEPQPPSNKIHLSLHPTLPSSHQRIRPPVMMKETQSHFI